MGDFKYKEFSKRRRPHYNPPDGTLFLTFRLAGSIPKAEVRHYRARLHYLQDQLKRVQSLCGDELATGMIEWRAKIEAMNREWFVKTENILHRAQDGPLWLSQPEVADKVAENLRRLDGDAIRLDAYSIIPIIYTRSSSLCSPSKSFRMHLIMRLKPTVLQIIPRFRR